MFKQQSYLLDQQKVREYGMNSNKMTNCLELANSKAESKKDRGNIAFKANQIGIKELPLCSRTYETPILVDAAARIGTSSANHRVG